MSDGMSARTCGECTACCTILPVKDIAKPGHTRCMFEGAGCALHGKPTMPHSCRLWSCSWLADPDTTAALERPDRAGYVIDVVPEVFTVTTIECEVYHLPAVQVWLDRSRVDAHRDPALRAYLARRAENGFYALIRESPENSWLLIAPLLSGHSDWIEYRDVTRGPENTPEQRATALLMARGDAI